MNVLCSLGSAHTDELWYSVVARFMRDRGYINRREAFQQLFGYRSGSVLMARPHEMVNIARQFEKQSVCSANEFAGRLTLIPYYLAFLPRSQSALPAQAAPEFQDLALNHWAFRSPFRSALLRYCRSCAYADIAAVGEAYWHRMHQLPGVYFCPDHGEPLLDSTVQYSPGKNNYWTAHQVRFELRPVPRLGGRKAAPFWRSVARHSRDALHIGSNGDLFLSREDYIELFRKCGFSASRGRVADHRLEKTLVEHFLFKGLDVNSFGPKRWWLRAFTEVPGRMFPVQHIVLQRFIQMLLKQAEIDTLITAHRKHQKTGVCT